MVTHSPEHAEYAGRVIQMLDGKVVAENFKQDPVLTIINNRHKILGHRTQD